MLTKSERQIVELLRQDPLLTPQQIAQKLSSTHAAVLVHLSNLSKKGVLLGRGYVLRQQKAVLVIGGSTLDLKARSLEQAQLGTSNPGSTRRAAGGVGRNIAENLAHLGTPTILVTAVGHDSDGEYLLHESQQAGVQVNHVIRMPQPTGRYTAILNSNGEMIVAVADMSATEALRPEHLYASRDLIRQARLLILDSNLPPETLGFALDVAKVASIPVLLDPVSTPKAMRMAPLLKAQRPIQTIAPNRDELEGLVGRTLADDQALIDAVNELHQQAIEQVWVRLGSKGSLLSVKPHPNAVPEQTFLPIHPKVSEKQIQDVTGAGDAALAVFAHALLQGYSPVQAARLGHAGASLTIQSAYTVRPDLTFDLVEQTLNKKLKKENL